MKKKQAGIWIDFKQADVFKFIGRSSEMLKVLSELQIGNVKGGSRSKVPWGPMDKVSESKMLNKKIAEKRSYFERVREAIVEFDSIVIVGPGIAKDEFRTFLKESKKSSPRILAFETMDSATMNQKRALIRELAGI